MWLQNKAQTMKITNRFIHIWNQSRLQRSSSVAFHKTKGSSGQCGVLEIVTVELWWDCHSLGWWHHQQYHHHLILQVIKVQATLSLYKFWLLDRLCWMIRNGKRLLFWSGFFFFKRDCKQTEITMMKCYSEGAIVHLQGGMGERTQKKKNPHPNTPLLRKTPPRMISCDQSPGTLVLCC